MARIEGVTNFGRHFYTQGPNYSVYGETIIKKDGKTYRRWEPSRSKLGAAIANGLSQLPIRKDTSVLYLGAASGTSVSHVADLAKEVYAVEMSKVSMRQLFRVVQRWDNVAPILCDALHWEKYKDIVPTVDVVFQDIASRIQLRIFEENVEQFLKKGGFAMLSLKAKSIDVAKNPKQIFREVEQELAQKYTIVDKRNLYPHQKDHMLYVIKK